MPAMSLVRISLLAVMAALLSACSSGPSSSSKSALVYQTERFKADETYSRLFDGNATDTCEAARRALLSQGYVISAASKGLVTGAKRFQPEG